MVAPSAEADIDLSGHFVGTGSVDVIGGVYCEVDMTQTVGVLSFSGSCADGAIPFSGTGGIDVQTGALTTAMSVPGYCSAAATTGHADATGYSFSGTGNGCGLSGSFSFSRCGNGIVDPGEDAACENANALGMMSIPCCGFFVGTFAPCCTPECTFKPASTVCEPIGPPVDAACLHEMCTGSDAGCESFPNPDGTTCPAEPDVGCNGDFCPADCGFCGPHPCPPGPCLTGQCVQGTCRSSPVADGTSCDLGDVCGVDRICLKATGQCVQGACRGIPVPDGTSCDLGAKCMTGQCVQGACLGRPVPDGTSCDLGECPNTGDTCRGGQCIAGSSPRCPVAAACCIQCDGPFFDLSCTPFCCPGGLVCARVGGVACVEPRTSSTTLPSATACDAVGIFAGARCLLGDALVAPLCQGQVPARFAQSMHSKLRSALGLLERATAMEGARRARVVKKVMLRLESARREVLRATRRKRSAHPLSAPCADTIRQLIADAEQRIAIP